MFFVAFTELFSLTQTRILRDYLPFGMLHAADFFLRIFSLYSSEILATFFLSVSSELSQNRRYFLRFSEVRGFENLLPGGGRF